MVTSFELTTKARMLDAIGRLPDDATIDDAIYRLRVIKAVAEGVKDIEDGRVYEHDEVFDELLRHDAKGSDDLVPPRKAGSGRNQKNHRQGQAKGGPRVRRQAKKGGD
jgi:hypothetical protein